MTFNPWKASTLVLAGALAFGAAGEIPEAAADGESQPHMRVALSQLKSARDQLKKATSDKGGHRAKAIALTNQAIEQVEKGIAHDEEH